MTASDVSAVAGGAARPIDGWRFCEDRYSPWEDLAAVEVPIAMVYNRFPFAVMLATPTDLEDFGIGFSLSEGIVDKAAEIADITVKTACDGVEIHLSVTKERYMGLRDRHRRSLMAGSSCGLCGADDFSEAMRPVDPVGSAQAFAAVAIHRAMRDLSAQQQLNRGVGAFHAAAFARADGTILAAREDVGRHNALDKVIGCLAREGVDGGAGFFVVSSRCSYEMVRKTAAAGVPLIAAVSAPTSLAIEMAQRSAVGLAAFARDDHFNLYAMRSRILD
jgi:FdhD protein